jgi:hypothetical protein
MQFLIKTLKANSVIQEEEEKKDDQIAFIVEAVLKIQNKLIT